MLLMVAKRSRLVLHWWLALVIVLLGGCGGKSVVREAGVARITVEEVNRRLERGETIVFVDSRSEASWEEGVAKIPGALRVPPHGSGEHLSGVPRGNPVVVYCT